MPPARFLGGECYLQKRMWINTHVSRVRMAWDIICYFHVTIAQHTLHNILRCMIFYFIVWEPSIKLIDKKCIIVQITYPCAYFIRWTYQYPRPFLQQCKCLVQKSKGMVILYCSGFQGKTHMDIIGSFQQRLAIHSKQEWNFRDAVV